MLVGLIRKGWDKLLAALPRALHATLDTWAEAEALRRAERRRQRLVRRQASKA